MSLPRAVVAAVLITAVLLAAPPATAAAPERVILDGEPTDGFIECGFPTTLATTGTLINRSDDTYLTANFQEHWANPATGTELIVRSAGSEAVHETADGLILESRGVFGKLTVPGMGPPIFFWVGKITFLIHEATGELEFLNNRGVVIDYSLDTICDLLSS